MALLHSAAWLLRQPWTLALQVAAALLPAVGAGLFPVRVPGTWISIAAGEISHREPGSADAAVVGAIIQLGGTLRNAVVAEGIEPPVQLEPLRRLGCGLGQGLHLAAPLGAPAAGVWPRGLRGALHGWCTDRALGPRLPAVLQRGAVAADPHWARPSIATQHQRS